MSEIWEQYVNKPQKEVLTSEKLRLELGDERKGVLVSVILIFAFVALLIAIVVVLGIWTTIPALLMGLFTGERFAFDALLSVACIILLFYIGVVVIRYFIRLHRARENGMKIVSAKVSDMRSTNVYRRHVIGTYEDRNITYYYLTFNVYGEICLQHFDYEFTDHPMAAEEVYFSTSVGDEFYLVSFKNNGDVIKAFPAKYFALSDELKEWLQ